MTASTGPRRDGIVDAHHHLWVRNRHPQEWIDPCTMSAIDADFEPSDLLAVARPAGITQTVVIQSIASMAETVDLLGLAVETELIGGVVGWVDLTAPDVSDRLAALRTEPGGDRLVGIRHLVQAEQDPHFLDRADVRRGIAAVGAAGAVFDLVIRDHQMLAAMRLAEALPDVPFVLDHLGKPPLVRGDLDDWATTLSELASLPNVTAKLSGLATEADWTTWTVSDLRPAVTHALEVFGPARLMFGSDWPVSLLATSYDRWVESLSDLVGGCTTQEQAMIWGGTARQVYGLGAR